MPLGDRWAGALVPDEYADDVWEHTSDGRSVRCRGEVFSSPVPSGMRIVSDHAAAAMVMAQNLHGRGSLGLEWDRAILMMLCRYRERGIRDGVREFLKTLWVTSSGSAEVKVEYLRSVLSVIDGVIDLGPLFGEQAEHFPERWMFLVRAESRVFLGNVGERMVFWWTIRMHSSEDALLGWTFNRNRGIFDDGCEWWWEAFQPVAVERFGEEVWDAAVFAEKLNF